MRILNEADVIRIMREEWNSKVAALKEEVEVVMTAKVDDGNEKLVVSPGLKVMHKSSGIRYTIDSVSPRDLILKTPEGEQVLIDKGEFESDYELD